MSEHTGLLIKALDDALGARISHIFGVLCVAPDLDEGLTKFETSLHRAIEAYDLVRTHLLKMV